MKLIKAFLLACVRSYGNLMYAYKHYEKQQEIFNEIYEKLLDKSD